MPMRFMLVRIRLIGTDVLFWFRLEDCPILRRCEVIGFPAIHGGQCDGGVERGLVNRVNGGGSRFICFCAVLRISVMAILPVHSASTPAAPHHEKEADDKYDPDPVLCEPFHAISPLV